MNFVINPSLQHMSLAKIAIQLGIEYFNLEKYTDTIRMNANFHKKPSYKFHQTHRQTHLQLASLSLCKLHSGANKCKGPALDLLWHHRQGKSVKLLLQRDRSLTLKQRYELACTFCLVDEVQDLLQEMPEEERLPVFAYSSLVQNNEQNLVVFFTQYVKHRLNDFDRDPIPYLSHYHEACHVAILSYNQVATKYFLQKLTPTEKGRMFSLLLVQFLPATADFYSCGFRAPREFSTDLTCFLLSQMDENQRVEFLKRYPRWVVGNLVVWPYNRDFLLETANHVWDYLQGSDFNHLLGSIFFHIDVGKEIGGSCEYRELYAELWRTSPVRHRRYVLDHLGISSEYDYFFSGEIELCKLIMSEANAAQKERLLMVHWKQIFYGLMVEKKRWNILKFIVEECGTSKEAIVRFKTQFTASVDLDFNDFETAQFIQFLDNFHPQKN